MMEAFDLDNPIHRISVMQFHRMIEAGVFADGEHVELIDGEMRDMAPIGPPHVGATNALTMLLVPPLAGKAVVSVQGPLVVDDGTEVYPDLLVLKPRDDHYASANPTGGDVLLAVEVADTSLATDTGLKRVKYARAGVPHYWVIDIRHHRLHDFRDPDRIAGSYRQRRSITSGPLSLNISGVEIAVDIDDLFPGS
jgi:Uma2 family endonuclease